MLKLGLVKRKNPVKASYILKVPAPPSRPDYRLYRLTVVVASWEKRLRLVR